MNEIILDYDQEEEEARKINTEMIIQV